MSTSSYTRTNELHAGYLKNNIKKYDIKEISLVTATSYLSKAKSS
jgi:hypothetical protein